jgi:hypothetical protein
MNCIKCFCGVCPEKKKCKPCNKKCGGGYIADCNTAKHKPIKKVI